MLLLSVFRYINLKKQFHCQINKRIWPIELLACVTVHHDHIFALDQNSVPILTYVLITHRASLTILLTRRFTQAIVMMVKLVKRKIQFFANCLSLNVITGSINCFSMRKTIILLQIHIHWHAKINFRTWRGGGGGSSVEMRIPMYVFRKINTE